MFPFSNYSDIMKWKGGAAMFVISRIESYKFSSASSVLAEAHRTLLKYDNPHYRPDLTCKNVFLVSPSFSGSFNDYLLSKKKELKCRMCIDSSLPDERQTNVLCQAFFGASGEFLRPMSRDEQLHYFQCCLDFFRSRFPSVEIVSAVVHYDETTPHLHISFLPLVEKFNSRGKLKTSFSSSALMPGADFFANYQTHFFNWMNDKYTDIQRGGDAPAEHLPVKTYKKVQDDLQALREEYAALQVESQKLLDTSPGLAVKIELAQTKKELSRYKRFCDFLFNKFPMLRVAFRDFKNSHKLSEYEK